MKKVLCVLLVVVGMMGLQVTANAATLQAGWQANIFGVSFWTNVWDPVNHYYYRMGIDGGHFSTPNGQYGPFTVSDGGGYYHDMERYVSVQTTVEAEPSDNLILPFTTSPGWTNAYISFAAGTNYDPSVMGLSLWRVNGDGTSTKIWSRLPGQTGDQNIFQPVTMQDYYFLVSVVPEPSSLCAFGTACLGMGWFGMRRRTRRA